MSTIDLDKLLHGNPSWREVADFFKNGEFFEEYYSVQAINKHLLTTYDRIVLFTCKLSVEDVLNGRFGEKEEPFVLELFDAWNKKLGFKYFGF